MAVTREGPRGPVVRRQPVRDHGATNAFGDGVGGQRDGTDTLQFLLRGGARRHHRGDEQRADVLDVDARIDLERLFVELTVEELVEADTTTQLSGNRRARRRAQQHVGGEQRLRRVGGLVGDATEDARLPGDACKSTTGQHQSARRHGN